MKVGIMQPYFFPVLDKLAVSEDAETKLAESAYGEAMADILLRQAVGIDVIE